MTAKGLLPGRLLVDLPNWVGDQVMALPAVHRLTSANSGGVTVLHCRPPVRRLFQVMYPDVEVVASFRRASPVTTARRLYKNGGRFSVGITLRHASRAKLLLFLVARRRFGSVGGGARLLLSQSFPVNRQRHQSFDADPILGALGLPGVDPSWRPSVPRSLVEEGERALARAGVQDRNLVGLAPAAVWGASKMWPSERFGQLASRVSDLGLQPVILVGPGEEDVAVAVQRAAGNDVPVLGADVDVAGLAGLMAHLRLLVCNDTGPMHIGAMLGARVVALFGPTDPVRTAPMGEGCVVVSRELDCAPCFEPRCPLGHNDCLQHLTVDEVADAVVRSIGEFTAATPRSVPAS
jgi:heptosyltransferase-2